MEEKIKEQDIRDRMKMLAKVKAGSIRQFEKECGLSATYINTMVLPSISKLRLLMQRYPDVNLEWLLLGNGSMLKDSSCAAECSIKLDETTCKALGRNGGNLHISITL